MLFKIGSFNFNPCTLFVNASSYGRVKANRSSRGLCLHIPTIQTCRIKPLTEGIKAIRKRLDLTPDEIAAKVGAESGAKILAFERDEAEPPAYVVSNYVKLESGLFMIFLNAYQKNKNHP